MLELTEDLLKKEPEKLAKKFIEISKKDGGITSTQIRKFYDDLLLDQKKAKVQDEETFKKKTLPLIRMTEAKIAYSVGRGVLNKTFYEDMSEYLRKIERKEDFENFVLFYQALIAYLKYEEVAKKQENDNQPKFEKKNYRNNNSYGNNNWGGYRK